MPKKFFISTAIDYPSTDPHVGHAYEKICADVLARFKRLQGFEVYFSTGTDEHGLKMLQSAKKTGKPPQKFVDEMSGKYKRVWDELGISYDDFIRTTEKRHHRVVQNVIQQIQRNGDIYPGKYKGLYCTECETFYTEKDLVDGKCPVHHQKVEEVEEEGYFFKMSKYKGKLCDHIQKHPEFIQPKSRRNEILNRLKTPLKDLYISRSGFKWGVPFPGDGEKTVYVWLDALANYLTTVGYPAEKFQTFWPADLHLIGKDIIWHHCVIWNSLLLSLGLPLPKQIFVHGFLTAKGQKISKSLGNVIDVSYLINRYSADALRYFLIRDIPLGEDGDFLEELLAIRLNDELADILGNLVHRVLSFTHRYFNGKVPGPEKLGKREKELLVSIEKTSTALEHLMEELDLNTGLNEIMKLAKAGNRYFNEAEPWRTFKEDLEKCKSTIWTSIQLLKGLALMLSPYLPFTAQRLWESLGLSGKVERQSWKSIGEEIKPGHPIEKPIPLFNKVPVKKNLGDCPAPHVSKDDFERLDIRVGEVSKAEEIPGSKKLLKLTVGVGEEHRVVVAGIAQQYRVQELLGKKVVVLLNLKPIRLMGIESQGMLLAAESEKGISLLTADESAPSGSKVR